MRLCILSSIFWSLFVGLSHQQESTVIQMRLRARDCQEGDSVAGAPEPYCIVYYGIGNNGYNKVGETKPIESYNPDWPEIFTFHYVESLDQRIWINIKESDVWFDDDWGSVYFTMEDLRNARNGNTMNLKFPYGLLLVEGK